MSKIYFPEANVSAQEVLSSLTPREEEVLRKRFGFGFDFGLNDSDENEQKHKEKTSFIPPSGNNGGQSGAPQIAIAPSPSSQDKNHNLSDGKTPKLRNH